MVALHIKKCNGTEMHLRFTVCIITFAHLSQFLIITYHQHNSSEMSAEEIASAFVNHFYTLVDSGNYTQLTTLYVIVFLLSSLTSSNLFFLIDL